MQRNIQDMLDGTKRSFTTRRVDLSRAQMLLEPDDMAAAGLAPRAGDVVMCDVETPGQHMGLQRPDGRRATLYLGDRIILTYGNRYAPDQFEAEVPEDAGPCELVAAGGLAGRTLSGHARMDAATGLRPIGVLADEEGRPLNVEDFRISAAWPTLSVPIIAVVGSSMNAGKTTAMAKLIRGLSLAGERVGAAKLTGTGAAGDLSSYIDAGARTVLDFTDAGYASTYKLPMGSVIDIVQRVTSQLSATGASVIVAEVADGLCQRETASLLCHPLFQDRVNNVVFAAVDSLGAIQGHGWLRRQGFDVAAVTGRFTQAPLAQREVLEATDAPVIHTLALEQPAVASRVLGIEPAAAAEARFGGNPVTLLDAANG